MSLAALLFLCLGVQDDPYAGVRTALARQGPDDRRTVEELPRALIALGSPAIPALYQLAIGVGLEPLIGETWVPEAWACTPEQIPEIGRRALAALPALDVIAHLQQVLRSKPVIKERVIVLRLLGSLPATEALAVVWSMTAELGDLELGYPSVRAAVRGAMGSILSRSSGGFDWVHEHLEDTDLATTRLLVEALGEVQLARGMPILVSLLERDVLPEAELLGSMATLEWNNPWVLAGTTARYLGPRLCSVDPDERALAATLVGRLLLPDMVPLLLELLDDGQPLVRGAAISSLALLAHKPADLDPASWSGWYRREHAWYEERVPELLEVLVGQASGPASDALRELFQHPLWKRELSRETAERLLQIPHPVRLVACTLIEEAKVCDGLPGLVQALTSSDSRLKKVAWRALRSLTGVERPLELAAWKELVARE